MQLVFDTNVLISATLWDKSVAQKLLLKLINSDIKIFSSDDILEEYREVLQEDFNYSDDKIALMMGRVISFVTLIKPTQKVNVIKADPDDNKIIDCAIASSSGYIVTYDQHLLEIKEFKGIKMIKPEELLNII